MARPLPALSPLCVAGSKAWAAERPITGLIFAKDGALIAEHSVGATRFGPLGEACEARDDDPTPPAFAREVKRGARRAVVDRSDDTIAVFHKDTQVQTLPASQRGARRALAWPPRGDVLAVATVPGFVEVWDIPTGTLRWSRFAGAGVHTLIWARDGDSLLVAVERCVVAFDAATGARLAPTQHVSPPRYLIPSRDGSALLSSSGGISFTEVDPHTMRWPLDDLGNPTFIEAVHVCDTDAGLLTCADVVTLHADAAHTIFAPTPPPDDFFWRGVSCLAAPTQAPLDFVCAIDRGGAGRVVRLDPAGVAPEVVLYQHRHRAPRLIALSLAAQRLAIGVTGRDVLLCDPVTGDITHTLRGLVRFPDGFAWRDEAMCAAFGLDQRLVVWRPDDDPSPLWSSGKFKSRAIAWAPSALLAADTSERLNVLDAERGEVRAQLHLGFVASALHVTPAGQLFAASEQGQLYHLPMPPEAL